MTGADTTERLRQDPEEQKNYTETHPDADRGLADRNTPDDT